MPIRGSECSFPVKEQSFSLAALQPSSLEANRVLDQAIVCIHTMEGRRSARLANQSSSPASSQPKSSPKTTGGAKRKSDGNTTPKAKRSKKASELEQKTIEQTMATYADPLA